MPLGLSAFAVPVPNEAGHGAGRGVEMRFAEGAAIASAEPLHFRITAAIDFREEKTLRLYLPGSGQNIGVLQIKYAHPFQPFQTTIAPRWLPELRRQGLGLELSQGTQDAWFLLPEGLERLRSGAEGLMPQLLSGGGPASEEQFRQRLYSMNSFSPFGWMGGCVQDALWELSLQQDPQAAQTLALHLGHYLDDQQGIVFEDPRTRPLDGTFNSIEDFLPFAAIVNLYPDHPSVQKAVDFCLARRNAQGLILSGRHVTTEGCYTLAYPLAAIAQIQQDPELARVALDQVRWRARLLVDRGAIYQRATLGGAQAYRNWGRGVAWYLLGTVKTLAVLQQLHGADAPGAEEVRDAFVSAAARVSSWASDAALWSSYLHRPETGVDTSASAGIAAALAWGTHLSLLPARYRRLCQASYQALLAYLTPDGFLTDVSQINRGGEALQEGGYRVISQFGMGLLAQLKAALDA